jgi:uncharacterized protein YcbK (DUF882 family)
LNSDVTDSCDFQRRRLLGVSLAVPALWLTRRAQGAALAGPVVLPPERKLLLMNTHTGESLSAAYCARGQYCSSALTQLNQLLRDHRSGECGSMDPVLFDLLHELALRADREPKFEVISGFRSRASNEGLRVTTSGVSRNSLHLQGKAIDVRLVGLNSAKLRDLAMDRALGGVGYYAKSDFVHLDTGRFRFWRG